MFQSMLQSKHQHIRTLNYVLQLGNTSATSSFSSTAIQETGVEKSRLVNVSHVLCAVLGACLKKSEVGTVECVLCVLCADNK